MTYILEEPENQDNKVFTIIARKATQPGVIILIGSNCPKETLEAMKKAIERELKTMEQKL